MESLANLLIYLIENKLGVQLAAQIMSLFVELSSIQFSSDALYLIGFVENLCISLQNSYISSAHSVTTKSEINWIHVFHLSLQMITNLVNQLRHHFVDIAITYVAIHLDHITDILTKVRTKPKTEDIHESIQIIILCHSLSLYHKTWKTNHLFSFQQIEDQVLKTSNSVIAFLIRPNFMSYLMDNHNTSAAEVVPSDTAPKRVSPTAAFDGKTLRKSVSWEQEFTSHSIDQNLMDSLFKFQAFSIAFLQNISPNILELMERQGFDANDWKLILNLSFSSPNIDPNLTVSFGSLINCIHMCIKTLNRVNDCLD